MMTEKGTLPVGVEFEGKVHREFEVRAQTVRDSLGAMKDEEASKDSDAYGVCLMARQVVGIGDIPKGAITAGLLLDLHARDFNALKEAETRLDNRLQTFRGDGEEQPETGAGADGTGV